MLFSILERNVAAFFSKSFKVISDLEFSTIETAIPTATLSSTFTNTPFLPLPTSTITPTPTETPVPSITPTDLPTKTPLPKPTKTVVFPPRQAKIENIIGYAQHFNLDCEARSATDLATYFGIIFTEMDFQSRLPVSDDPEEGFVGNYHHPRGNIPPRSYGVHAGPVAALLRKYGLNAHDHKQMSWERIRIEIASGRPVIAWVIYQSFPGWPISYTASNGNTTIVAHYEHTVIIIGYDPMHITILDGNMIYKRTIRQFSDSWSVLGNMAITVGDPPLLDSKD